MIPIILSLKVKCSDGSWSLEDSEENILMLNNSNYSHITNATISIFILINFKICVNINGLISALLWFRSNINKSPIFEFNISILNNFLDKGIRFFKIINRNVKISSLIKNLVRIYITNSFFKSNWLTKWCYQK